jgi:hypothetical protein
MGYRMRNNEGNEDVMDESGTTDVNKITPN